MTQLVFIHLGAMHRPNEAWLVLLRDGEPTQIVTHSDTRVGLIDLHWEEGEAAYRATGHWGGYEDREGTVMRYGAIQGILRWHGTGSHIPSRCAWIILDAPGARNCPRPHPRGGHQVRQPRHPER